MEKEDAIKIADELNQLGISYIFEAVENYESPEPNCDGCNTSDHCWTVN